MILSTASRRTITHNHQGPSLAEAALGIHNSALVLANHCTATIYVQIMCTEHQHTAWYKGISVCGEKAVPYGIL